MNGICKWFYVYIMGHLSWTKVIFIIIFTIWLFQLVFLLTLDEHLLSIEYLSGYFVETTSILFVLVIVDFFIRKNQQLNYERLNAKNYSDIKTLCSVMVNRIILTNPDVKKEFKIDSQNFFKTIDSKKEELQSKEFAENFKKHYQSLANDENKLVEINTFFDNQYKELNKKIEEFYPFPNQKILIELEQTHINLKSFFMIIEKVASIKTSPELKSLLEKNNELNKLDDMYKLLSKVLTIDENSFEKYIALLVKIHDSKNLNSLV